MRFARGGVQGGRGATRRRAGTGRGVGEWQQVAAGLWQLATRREEGWRLGSSGAGLQLCVAACEWRVAPLSRHTPAPLWVAGGDTQGMVRHAGDGATRWGW